MQRDSAPVSADGEGVNADKALAPPDSLPLRDEDIPREVLEAVVGALSAALIADFETNPPECLRAEEPYTQDGVAA